jgi:hypothetical protein
VNRNKKGNLLKKIMQAKVDGTLATLQRFERKEEKSQKTTLRNM